ncbi:TPR repeat containing protein [Methylophaga frappieri]|uniref:TPR repeat containing protein n=1 Tax=Methylophaga frappieri (strain ATCC BAA-2434 / DSM 25690 / JAM7) TaxID=754477 RepID=I1YF26_METFJ|nr:tetratricopeptide repeat protein [Methylophaga frappieri]AFJ01519.1 TPR repeat containing protein [Methylophaga frappieri]
MFGRLTLVLLLLCPLCVGAETDETLPADFEQQVETLDAPVYSPFIERYVLDELKQLRTEMAAQRHEMTQQIVDREINAVDKAVSYATNTVTYFFYLIAGATSILVLVGWTSIREIRERVHSLADEEISKLVSEYERRLHAIEQQLNQKTQHIEENREEIERTQGLQSLWLRAAQENSAAHKIGIYDQILKIKRDDVEALTYKADAVLELGEPQWASNLCHQALLVDPENSHAFYQLACAHTGMEQYEEAIHYLSEAIQRSESYRDEITNDKALAALQSHPGVQKLINPNSATAD